MPDDSDDSDSNKNADKNDKPTSTYLADEDETSSAGSGSEDAHSKSFGWYVKYPKKALASDTVTESELDTRFNLSNKGAGE